MKTIEQILELIKLNAYSGTPENIQAIVELVNEAQNQAFCQPPVMGWVAMKDKEPPDVVEFYLTYNCLGEYKILEWYEGSCFMWCTGGHWSNNNGKKEQGITHWIAIPEPPCT